MRLSHSTLSPYFLLFMLFAPIGLSAAEQKIVVRMETSLGNIDVELFPDVAPRTVENFLKYMNDGDFTNTYIHRSVPGFIIQGGGFKFENGAASAVPADPPVINEFKRSNIRGTIAMAKLGGDPNSATSEWFFNLADNSANLDAQNGGFTVFGRVIGNGMAVVDAIAALPRWNLGGAASDIPLINYPGSGQVVRDNLVMISRVASEDVAADADDDGAPDSGDNCPQDANAGQEDQDDDGVGDVCDVCPKDANAGQGDQDDDGVGDVCDVCPNDAEDDCDSLCFPIKSSNGKVVTICL